jgi:hypothetical protein
MFCGFAAELEDLISGCVRLEKSVVEDRGEVLGG